MRRRSYINNKWNERNTGAYSRGKAPTRYYTRKSTGSVVAALAGMNTTSDDFAKKQGESPYLWNARLNGTKEDRKRAQSMSRMGQQMFGMPEGAENEYLALPGESRISISENKSVRWSVDIPERLTAVGLRFSFEEVPINTNAHFIVILRNSDGKEVCRAVRKVTELYEHQDELQWFRFIVTVEGTVTLEATLVDDMDNNGTATKFVMYINATGSENHDYSEHDLPNLDSALREKPYDWKRGLGIPVTCFKTCVWKVFTTWLQRGYFNSEYARWTVMGCEDERGRKMLYAVKFAEFNPITGAITKIDEPEFRLLTRDIRDEVDTVRMAQAGNCLYLVDGISPLRKVVLDGDPSSWTVVDAVPDMNDVDTFGYLGGMYYYANSVIVADKGSGTKFYKCKEDHQGLDTFTSENEGKHEYDYWEDAGGPETLTAWRGASLIYFLNNRLILSGFRRPTVGLGTPKAEPNLVIMSSITSVRPQYDMFQRDIEFFYVPDKSPSSSAAAPVTGFAHIGDYLFIFTADGLVCETIQSAVEFGGIAQSVPEGSQYGVMRQEHIAEGPNNIYFFNPTMGIMRTAGSTATLMSSPVDSIFAGMSDVTKLNAHLCMTGDILRFYYGEDGVNNMSLVDYAAITQHRSYWFRDQNTPVLCTSIDLGSDTYLAMHSQYPCVFKVDEGYYDFDCAILYEYYTKYIGTPDKLDHIIVRRIHLTTLQTFQSSVYIGLDYDHNNKPIVWRRFITPTVKGEFRSEDIFSDDEESNATNIDIRILTDDTRFVQLRIKQYCYDFQAEILQIGFEYANRTTL